MTRHVEKPGQVSKEEAFILAALKELVHAQFALWGQ